jgi:predicted nucleic acid-binding protein
MKNVFLNTVGMIAVWDDTDQWHDVAQAAYELLFSQGRKLTTTPFVLGECGNASARRTYRSDVCELRRSLIQEGLLIEPTAQEIEAAWEDYEQGKAAQAGIVDHVSFQVMRRLGITDVFTNDKHFQAAGFTVLF